MAGVREGPFTLDADASRYLCGVYRLTAGDDFVAFDPLARVEAAGTIIAADARSAACKLGPIRAATRVPSRQIVLVQAMAKGDKIDRVVGDGTTLGAGKIVLVETERSQVRLGDRADKRRARWHTIAVQAARQSGRGDVPEVSGPVPLKRFLAGLGRDDSVRWILSPVADLRLADALEGAADGPVMLVVGPEGGLSPDEEVAAKSAGFEAVRLGAFTLRTETAATAALGAIAARDPVPKARC